jgi:general secretion pathway protein J
VDRRTIGNPKNSTDGFTLLEILIAIFIFAVVLTTIFTSYTGTSRVVNETESQAEIYRMAGITMERLLEDLQSIYIPKTGKGSESEGGSPHVSQFVGEDREIEGRSADGLRFSSTAHIDLSGQEQESGAAEISYYVEENDEGDGLVLYRRDTPISEQTPPGEEQAGGLVLCDRLTSVNFTYYEETSRAYDSWDSATAELKDKIPKMVSISLEFLNSIDPEVPLRFATSVALLTEQGYPW